MFSLGCNRSFLIWSDSVHMLKNNMFIKKGWDHAIPEYYSEYYMVPLVYILIIPIALSTELIKMISKNTGAMYLIVIVNNFSRLNAPEHFTSSTIA